MTLSKFNAFLLKVDLAGSRAKYKDIKSFEADMSPDIQALESIYETYWDNPKDELPNFDEFFDNYYYVEPLKGRAIEFNKNRVGLCDHCFSKGIRARIYRTWASLITQIQGGYAAAEIFGRENIFQNVELDHSGIDILIKYKGCKIGVQVKKKTGRREIANRRPEPKEQKFADTIVPLFYFVPSEEDYKNPKYKVNGRGFKKDDWKPMAQLFGLDGRDAILNRSKNGFVIFTTKFFEELKKLYDRKTI